MGLFIWGAYLLGVNALLRFTTGFLCRQKIASPTTVPWVERRGLDNLRQANVQS